MRDTLIPKVRGVPFPPSISFSQPASGVCVAFVNPQRRHVMRPTTRITNPLILKFLTIKRPPDASRAEFFVHAEAFAALVHLEFVSIQGAVTTILTLLRKPDNRCAAVTMLGKTVELCAPQLVAQGDPGKMEELRKAVLGLKEEAFRYDVNYVRDSLGWTDSPITSTTSPAPAATAATAATGALPAVPHATAALSAAMLVPVDSYHGHLHTILAVGVDNNSGAAASHHHSSISSPCSLCFSHHHLFPSAMLVPVDSYHGHQHTILAVGVDSNSGATWSAAMDGSLIMWGADGKPRQSLLLGSHYVCGMDLLYSPPSLLLAAAPRDDMSEGQAASHPVAPCILQLTGDEGAGGGAGGGGGGGGWQVTGRLDRNQTSVISCIKAIGIHPDLAFITAESMAPSDGSPASPRDRICCYDLTGAPFSSLHPVRQYTEHEDLITCLTVFPPNPNLFLSGSRDTTIRLWDRRASNAVVASGGMDGYLKLWDLRSLHSLGNSPPLGSLNLDESPILKLASSMLPGVVAVSTVRGLYLADLSGSVGPSGGGVARLAGGFQDGRQPGRYHDIKWAHGRRLLFAGGDAMRVDVYGLQ
ncbi:unnamed protein product [Closterium sp. Yama58-4]|nr:unnamed protein product [Closterium sp. Yama58-4]